ncbi:MAG: DUF362 domain-containing protein [Candidatus Bathyarchaeota archaeon]
MSKVVVVQGENPFQIVEKGLKFFSKPARRKIVIKPNLISAEEPPTTTPYDVVEALVDYYVKDGFDVIIAEGSGWCETFQAYRKLDYFKLAEKYKVKLVDLNNDNFNVVRNPHAFFLKEFEYPLTLRDAYIVSTPVLKEHSITKVTLSLKNMLGATLGEKAKMAKKGRFHRKLDESIVDVNLYLKPSLAVIDGRIAGLGGELSAKPKKLGITVFSEDLVAADAVAAGYLGINPSSVRHLTLAEKAGLGVADLSRIEVVKVE